MTIKDYLGDDKQVKANCAICGKQMIVKADSKGVVISSTGLPQHSKCMPKDRYLSDLKDAILLAYTYHYANEEVLNRGLFWKNIISQIKQLCDKGYTTEEQLNCFNLCVERDKVYWGYGRVNRFIEADTIRYRQYKELIKKQQEESRMKVIKNDEETVIIRKHTTGLIGGYDSFNERFDEEED